VVQVRQAAGKEKFAARQIAETFSAARCRTSSAPDAADRLDKDIALDAI